MSDAEGTQIFNLCGQRDCIPLPFYLKPNTDSMSVGRTG
jgi:hypothetical protein